MMQKEVEFRRDPNIVGEIKTWAVAHAPGLYVRARHLKELLRQTSQFWRFPYVSRKEIADISFGIQVTNWREQLRVDGPYFETELLGAMVESIRQDDVIFDVGAATGTHTIPAALKTGANGIVYSFEPDEDCTAGLRNNIMFNSLGNVVVLQTALWREDANLILNSGSRKGNVARVGEKDGPLVQGFRRHQLIQARSIESLVRTGQVKPPDVLKIDVEGAGQAVLQGLGNIRPRDIFMEVHPPFGENKDEIVEFLKSRGYQEVWEQIRRRELHIQFAISTSKTATL